MPEEPDRSPFTETTRQRLAEAGWDEARTVDIRPYLIALRARGYPIFPVVRAFLRSFGGLVVTYSLTFDTTIVTEDLDFEVLAAVAGVRPEALAFYAEILGEVPLCPIGAYSRKYAWSLMDAQGRVYGGCEDDLYFLGETGRQAIERLMANHLVPIYLEPR